jgi:hypothetical protein
MHRSAVKLDARRSNADWLQTVFFDAAHIAAPAIGGGDALTQATRRVFSQRIFDAHASSGATDGVTQVTAADAGATGGVVFGDADCTTAIAALGASVADGWTASRQRSATCENEQERLWA